MTEQQIALYVCLLQLEVMVHFACYNCGYVKVVGSTMLEADAVISPDVYTSTLCTRGLVHHTADSPNCHDPKFELFIPLFAVQAQDETAYS